MRLRPASAGPRRGSDAYVRATRLVHTPLRVFTPGSGPTRLRVFTPGSGPLRPCARVIVGCMSDRAHDVHGGLVDGPAGLPCGRLRGSSPRVNTLMDADLFGFLRSCSGRSSRRTTGTPL